MVKNLQYVFNTVMVFNLLPHQTIASSLKTAETSGGTDVVTSAMEEVKDVEPASIMAEITENRTEFSKEFKLSNGQHMTVVYPEAVHYQKDGQWKDIDNTLTATGTRSAGTYRNAQGTWQVAFPQQLRGDNRVSVTEKGYTVSFGMAGELTAIIAEKAEAGSSAVMRQNALDQTVLTVSQMQTSVAQIIEKDAALIADSTEFPEIVPQKLTSRLTYNNVYANTDITYDLSSGRLKESVVLNSYNASVRGYRYVLETSGLIPVLNDDNSIDLVVPDSKEIIMSMPAPYMIDNAGITNTDVGVSLIASGESYILAYTMPMAWMAEADRAWPVVLDPIIEADYHRLNVLDQFVAESYYEDNNHGTMYTGYYGPFGKMRAFLQYVELPEMTSADVIVNATLTLRRHGGTSDTTVVEAHKVDDKWQSKKITWETQPDHSDIVEDYALVTGNGTYEWEITDVVRDWYTSKNTGVMLKAPDSVENGGVANWKKFYTIDYDVTDSSTWPYLYITFRNNNGLEDYWDYTASSAGRAGTGYVNNYSGNLTWVHSDLGFGGNRMPVSISHIYNANDSAENRFGLGYGWRTNFNQMVALWEEDSTYYVWEDGDGTKHYFKYASANTYKDEDGLELTLTVSGNNKTITDKYGNTSHFDSNGRLWKLENNQQENSNIEIIYVDSTSKLISRIEDGIDRKYNFYYDENNLLEEISFFGKKAWSLAYILFYYSNGRLTSIEYEDGETSTFTYDSANFLLSATDIDGYGLAYTYSTTVPKRVVGINEYDGITSGGSMSIEYAHNQTTFTDNNNNNNNNVQIMQFNNWGNTVSIQDGEGRAQYAQYASNEPSTNGVKGNQLTLSSKLQDTVTNLIKNSSFEDTTSTVMWSTNSSTITRTHSTEAPYLGSRSMKLVASTTSNRYGAYSPQFSVEPGETIAFSAYIKTVDAAVRIAIERSTNYHIFDGTLIAEGQDWSRYQFSYTNTSSETEFFRGYFFVQDPGTVYVDCVQLEKEAIASRYNLVDNGDFQYGDYNWNKTGMTSSDISVDGDTIQEPSKDEPGLDTPSELDTMVYRITGSPTAAKYLSQTIPVSGSSGDSYVLAGWAKGDSVPLLADTDRTFGLQVIFNHTDGGTNSVPVSFNPDSDSANNWQYVATAAVATENYSSITVQVRYNYNANTVYFDGIQLFKEMFGTSYAYDNNGNIESVIDLQNQKTKYSYTNNNLTQIIPANGAKMTYEYDAWHNVIKATIVHEEADVADEVYEFLYDTYGNNTRVRIIYNGYTIQSTATYSPDKNRLVSITDALGKTTTYCYNEDTNVLEWVRYPNDTAATQTEYEYDEMYRLDAVLQNVSDSNNTLRALYSYDYDLLTWLSTASTTYTFTYGAFSQISCIKAGNYTLASYTYTNDANRYLSEVFYGNWHSVLYDYDELGRLVQETFEDDLGEPIGTNTYQYNDLGEVATVVDTISGLTTTYHRDLIGRLAAYEESGTDYFHRATYGYDTKNNLTNLNDTVLGTVYKSEYTYDDANRVTKVKDGRVSRTYTYDSFSRPSTAETNHSTSKVLTQTDTYVTGYVEGVGNVTTGQVHTRSYTAAGYNKTFTYTYDDNGNILSVSDGTYTTSYEYDSANQLIRENNQAGGFTHVWTYDEAGNILYRVEYDYTTGTLDDSGYYIEYFYDYSSWGDLLSEYNGIWYDYDGMGNRVCDDNWDYEWQKGRQLLGMFNGASDWTFYYNADGMRIGRADHENGTEYTYYYNGSLLRVMTVDGNKLYFVYDASGTPIEVSYTPAGSTTVGFYYFVTNLQGDVIAILNSSGTVVVEYTYDAWGKILSITGSMAATLGVQNPLRYRGYVYDQETGLYYLQSRYYDPEIGRFINADVFTSTGQGLLGNNMFAYCLNNPVRYVDIAGFLAHDALEIGDNDDKLDPNDDGAPGNGSIAITNSPTPNGSGSTGNSSPASSGGNPLNSLTYTNKVSAQMQQGDDHGFPPIVDNYGSYGIQSSEVGRDGQTYSHLRIYGSYKGAEGYFHYIWDNNFTCNHRQFERVLHQ